MELLITSLAFIVAALCAATMGFAIQRGATCTVAAVDELLQRRSATRLVALVEASLWVAGGLLVAQQLHALVRVPAGYALTAWTLAGAALLGVGAFVNRACVFGAIARLGSGEWVYLATPLGFYLGCLSVEALFAPPAAVPLAAGSPVLAAPGWAAWLVLAAMGWRLTRPLIALRHTPLRALVATRLWAPRSATAVIGVTFLLMLLAVGAWAYTDVLAELARGMAHSLAARLLLFVCLLFGATLGGWTAGRFKPTPIDARALLRCLAGGVLMGWGSLLIPGGNDGLILVGMPLLWPYAWAAFATMCASIGVAQWLQRRLPVGARVGA
ncbi:MAG TPA: YeeE/YedE thiosulfate transporter family protein [Albitalea sp.]|nr:YeeE/YedE thiosulfate transporter family protein [Albitalea sp.]